METHVIKTIEWLPNKAQLKTLVQKNLGHPKKWNALSGFDELICSYPQVKRAQWAAFFEEVTKRHEFSDVSSMAQIFEDSCLFSAIDCSALDIIKRHLDILNTGGKIPALWSFLDEDKKAVVHFVNQGGWYAEAYFLSNDDFSVLHVYEDNGLAAFLPVSFSQDISEQIALAQKENSFCLQTYLPRDLYGFLSKKGKANNGESKKEIEEPEAQTSVEGSGAHEFDDFL